MSMRVLGGSGGQKRPSWIPELADRASQGIGCEVSDRTHHGRWDEVKEDLIIIIKRYESSVRR